MNPTAIVKSTGNKYWQQPGIFCCYDSAEIDQFTPDMLSVDYWQQRRAISGSAQGRGTTWFIRHQQQHWVLRHYYRGGLVGKLIRDSYWFTSWASTRAAREYALLQTLQTLGLPAPKPIAYRATRRGLRYCADILSERIQQAQDLVAILTQQSLGTEVWHDIGATIGRFHHHGIYHHDLNAHNILLDTQNKVWLIDFDRGEQRQPATSWQNSNMSRLLRSLEKERQQHPVLHWQEGNWQALLDGYQRAI